MAPHTIKALAFLVGTSTLSVLVVGASGATAQEIITKPHFIGLWQNLGTGGRCQFFPRSVQISAASETHATITFPGGIGFDATERPKRDSEMIGGPTGETEIETPWDKFRLIDDNTMVFTQIGPDGFDSCNFVKSQAEK